MSPAETLTMLRPLCGDRTMKKSVAYDWHKPFLDGREILRCAIPVVCLKYKVR